MLLLLLSIAVISSTTEAKYTLIVFEGSDWCANCMRFEKQVLADQSFKEFANNNSIEIERIDFPQRKKQEKAVKEYNASKAEQYGFDGKFPSIILVENSGDKVTVLKFDNHDAASFIDLIKSKIEAS